MSWPSWPRPLTPWPAAWKNRPVPPQLHGQYRSRAAHAHDHHQGFIDGMLDGTIPPENQNHYLGIVSQEVGRLTRLIKNMLDITKLEAGEYKVNATTYDIWESITSVVFGAEQRLEANNIQISGFAPTKTLVLADQDLVYQVIYNLVDNAIKFCNVGGEIRFSVTQSKGAVTVGVRNTGAGIAPEALPYVFDRFYKEDKSRGLNTTGSGLGLHICKSSSICPAARSGWTARRANTANSCSRCPRRLLRPLRAASSRISDHRAA